MLTEAACARVNGDFTGRALAGFHGLRSASQYRPTVGYGIDRLRESAVYPVSKLRTIA